MDMYMEFLRKEGYEGLMDDIHKCRQLMLGLCDLVWEARTTDQGVLGHMLEIAASSLNMIEENLEAGKYNEPIKKKNSKHLKKVE